MNVLREEIFVVTSAKIHWAPTSAPVPQAIHYKKMVTHVLVSERRTLILILYYYYLCLLVPDRCAEGSQECEHVCHNTGAGSYTCSCYRGYKLADNGHSCEGKYTKT